MIQNKILKNISLNDQIKYFKKLYGIKNIKKLKYNFFNNLIVILAMLYAGLVIHDIRKGLIIISIFQVLYIIGIVSWIYKIAKVNNNILI